MLILSATSAEMLTEHDKGCGNLVTFSHMVVVAGFAALENVNWTTLQFQACPGSGSVTCCTARSFTVSRQERKIALRFYVKLVLMFFVVQADRPFACRQPLFRCLTRPRCCRLADGQQQSLRLQHILPVAPGAPHARGSRSTVVSRRITGVRSSARARCWRRCWSVCSTSNAATSP